MLALSTPRFRVYKRGFDLKEEKNGKQQTMLALRSGADVRTVFLQQAIQGDCLESHKAASCSCYGEAQSHCVWANNGGSWPGGVFVGRDGGTDDVAVESGEGRRGWSATRGLDVGR